MEMAAGRADGRLGEAVAARAAVRAGGCATQKRAEGEDLAKSAVGEP